MWTFDDIEKMNPPESGQKASILSHLLKIGSTWPKLLCDTADELDELGPPFVCCFAQLQFPIIVEKAMYVVEGKTHGIDVHLDCRQIQLEIDHRFTVKISEQLPSGTSAVIATQFRGFIQLWGRRVAYYRNYVACVHAEGLAKRIINPDGSEWKKLHGKYSGILLSSHTFESELATRLRDEFFVALRKFLLSYSLVAREELPPLSWLYGYFIMPAPGRIVYSRPPDPLLLSMLPSWTTDLRQPVAKERVSKTIRFGFTEFDRYVHQLLAMNRLASFCRETGSGDLN